jgi:8-oxo-dGTP pyrophosphatase MutT (NUDIX family)
MQEATLCLVMRDNPSLEVLLGLKKEGFGAGKYTGFGGKVEPGETPVVAAIRELEEEAGVKVHTEDLEPVGQLTFLFPARPSWSQKVYVFRAKVWDGNPRESREMIPVWFAIEDIPFDQMWQDGLCWLPRILAGERIMAHFRFCSDNETVDHAEIVMWDALGTVSM